MWQKTLREIWPKRPMGRISEKNGQSPRMSHFKTTKMSAKKRYAKNEQKNDGKKRCAKIGKKNSVNMHEKKQKLRQKRQKIYRKFNFSSLKKITKIGSHILAQRNISFPTISHLPRKFKVFKFLIL